MLVVGGQLYRLQVCMCGDARQIKPKNQAAGGKIMASKCGKGLKASEYMISRVENGAVPSFKRSWGRAVHGLHLETRRTAVASEGDSMHGQHDHRPCPGMLYNGNDPQTRPRNRSSSLAVDQTGCMLGTAHATAAHCQTQRHARPQENCNLARKPRQHGAEPAWSITGSPPSKQTTFSIPHCCYPHDPTNSPASVWASATSARHQTSATQRTRRMRTERRACSAVRAPSVVPCVVRGLQGDPSRCDARSGRSWRNERSFRRELTCGGSEAESAGSTFWMQGSLTLLERAYLWTRTTLLTWLAPSPTSATRKAHARDAQKEKTRPRKWCSSQSERLGTRAEGLQLTQLRKKNLTCG
eukprot:6193789-Pleurochrysis_carterae.AAC.3